MNNGSFFRLALESSKVVNGIAFYEYMDLPDLLVGDDGIKYPVKLTITSTNITFYIHYFANSRSFIPSHTEEVILDLPYQTVNKESLSSIIKHSYNTVFPISDYLQKIVKLRYEDDESDEGKKYIPIRQSIIENSYSSLFVWGLMGRDDSMPLYQLKDKQNSQDQNKGQRITKFLRKLLLDFMFDLMHSDVFESSKYYSQMREGLMSDFFFSSIVKKSEYYYNRRLVRSVLDTVINDDKLLDLQNIVSEIRKQRRKGRINEQEDSTNKAVYDTIKALNGLYAEKLDESEVEWINVIMSPMAEKHFSFYPNWYEDRTPRKKRDGFCVSESWFVNPEEEMARVVFPLEEESEQKEKKHSFSFLVNLIKSKGLGNEGDKMHYLNSFELSDLISVKDGSSIRSRKTMISKWFFRRFDFADTFRLHLFKGWNDFMVILLSFFAVLAITIPCFWRSPISVALFVAAVSVFFLFSALLYNKNSKRIKTECIDDFFVKSLYERNKRKTVRLSLLFLALGLFFFFYESSSLWCMLIKLLLLVGFAIFLLYKVSPRVHIINNIHLLLPRLVASITAGWLMLVIGNELINEHLSWPVLVILSVVVFSFILYESNKVLPNISNGQRIWRALELMVISYSISLEIGIFAINILTPSLLQNEKGIDSAPWWFLKGCDELKLTIFPEYLIQFSFLAMFIGVFIQMISEEKGITEM